MAIIGLRTTSNFATDERPKNWREGILMLYPNGKCPLTALTAAMKSRSTDDPEFNWWEKQLQTRSFALTTTITASASTFAASAGGLKAFKKGDVFYNFGSGEYVRMAADPVSDTSANFERGAANSTAAAITVGGAGVDPNWYCVGSANREGSDAPTGVAFDPTKQYNYTQIFRNTLEATRTAMGTRLRTKAQAVEAKRECLEIHGLDMERAFFLGKKYETTESGTPIRYTDGLLNRVDSSNIFTWGTAHSDTTRYAGTKKFQDFEDIMRCWFQYGSNEKVVFGGDIAVQNMQRLIRNAKGIQWNMAPDKEFGMNVTRVTSSMGTIVLKQHPMFTDMISGVVAATAYNGMNSWLWCVDMDNLKYVYFKDADTKYQANLQDNGVDGSKSGYLTECGLEIHHAKTHGILKGFSSYTAE